VFVDRRRRGRVRAQRDEMVDRLRAGDDLVLFPEGTSDDGNRILPFKSALLGAAEIDVDGRPVTVQPVSIAYTRLDGIPLGRAFRPLLAWYGDMDLLPHLWRVFSLGEVAVEVTFHPWTTHAEFPGRRALTDYCHRHVAGGLAASIAGRRGEGDWAPASPGTAPRALPAAAAPPATAPPAAAPPAAAPPAAQP
jgi:1-acyl-sn-glycerol-3-phosphate acyltransferase